jgi:hypothetical protein
MKTFLDNVVLTVTRPKKLYSTLSEKPNLNHAIWLVLAIGMIHGLQIITDRNMAEQLHLKNEPGLLGMILYAGIFGLLIVLQTSFQVVIKVVCAKIAFNFLRIKSNMRTLVTVLVFTIVPLLIREFIRVFWAGYEGAVDFGGRHKISYFKTSLAQFVANSNFTNKITFSLLTEFEIFAIWSFILGVIAVAAVGKVSYKTSTFIMLFSWVISSLVLLISV